MTTAKFHPPFKGERCLCNWPSRQDRHGMIVRAGLIVCAKTKAPVMRTCSACHKPRPLGEYQVFHYAGRAWQRVTYCRSCRAERARAYREGQRIERGYERATFHNWSKATLLARTQALVAAAREARSTGAWQGKEGIRAYAALGEALEPFHNNVENPDALDDLRAPAVVDPEEIGPFRIAGGAMR